MDVSGSLNFGRLIRTFLPGFLGLLVFLLFVDSFIHLSFGTRYPIFIWLEKNPLLFALLSLPISLIVGVLLNTIYIFSLFPFVIKEPYKKKNVEFIRFEAETVNYLIDQRLSRSIPNINIDTVIQYLEKDFLKEAFSHGFIPTEKLIYQEESFLDYLEFQLILAFIFIFFCISLIINLLVYGVFIRLGSTISLTIILICIIGTTTIVTMLLRAARLNYDFHKKSMFGLILGQYTSIADFSSSFINKNNDKKKASGK